MIIDEKEMQRRLNSSKNLVNSLGLKIGENNPSIVREPMRKYTPPADKGLKITAACLVAQGESVADISKAFNLSPAQIRAEKNNPSVIDTMERVRNLALDKTLIALGLMSAEKFENASLKDLAAVAGSLSRVIEKTQGRDTGNVVQFIVHAPAEKSLGHYKVVDV